MAYNTRYLIEFTNELSQEVKIFLQKKDGEATTEPVKYAARAVKKSYKGDEGKYSPIIGCSVEVTFDMRPGDVDYWPEFADAELDIWKMLVTLDGQTDFIGFVIPDENVRPFQDAPYDSKITASDGLGLLKDGEHKQPDGTDHEGDNFIIWHIASALQQTGLTLPIRIYDNVFHKSMQYPDDDQKWCMFNQTKLEARSFKKDAIEFVSPWEALNIILSGTYQLSQWSGRWVIIRIGMIQYYPFVKYYAETDYNGANAFGGIDENSYPTVGKAEMIYPINEDQLRSHKPAIKSMQSYFNYNIWPEIPKNNKFERGQLLETGTANDEYDLDGDNNTSESIGTFYNYSIDGWEFGRVRIGEGGFPVFPFNLTAAAPQRAYSKRIKDIQGIEIDRYVHIDVPNSGTLWLKSEGVPVRAGDRIKVSFDQAIQKNFGSADVERGVNIVRVYVVQESTFYGLNENKQWKKGSVQNLSVYYPPGSDLRDFTNFSIEPNTIPISGKLYIVLNADGDGDLGTFVRVKNFLFEYQPFVAGGYQQVKGDYWITSQNKKYPDKISEEIFISDSRHKVVKGCLLNSNGIPFTPDWQRIGLNESRHFKEISNLEKYNLHYRRFWGIEGSFTGITMAPVNNKTNVLPIGVWIPFRFVDIPEDRRFMLSTPLDLDYITGNIKANFLEVFKDEAQTVTEIETIQRFTERIRQRIDATTASQWQAGGGAPAPGTPGFPPQTLNWIGYISPDAYSRSFMVRMNFGAQMTISTDAGIVIERVLNPNVNGYALMGYTVSQYKLGAKIIIKAYGLNIEMTVGGTTTTIYPDGQQLGDTHEFKYRFE